MQNLIRAFVSPIFFWVLYIQVRSYFFSEHIWISTQDCQSEGKVATCFSFLIIIFLFETKLLELD